MVSVNLWAYYSFPFSASALITTNISLQHSRPVFPFTPSVHSNCQHAHLWIHHFLICCEVLRMCICLCVSTCVFPFRKYVLAGNWSPQRPAGVWSLHIHEVRPTAAEPTATFLQASVVMLITGWISAGGGVPVKRCVTYRRHVSCCRAV